MSDLLLSVMGARRLPRSQEAPQRGPGAPAAEASRLGGKRRPHWPEISGSAARPSTSTCVSGPDRDVGVLPGVQGSALGMGEDG